MMVTFTTFLAPRINLDGGGQVIKLSEGEVFSSLIYDINIYYHRLPSCWYQNGIGSESISRIAKINLCFIKLCLEKWSQFLQLEKKSVKNCSFNGYLYSFLRPRHIVLQHLRKKHRCKIWHLKRDTIHTKLQF